MQAHHDAPTIEEVFHNLRAPVAALQHAWQRRIEGPQLRARFDALQVAMAAASEPLARWDTVTEQEEAVIFAAHAATIELGEFLLRSERQSCGSLVFGVLDVVAEMVEAWSELMSDGLEEGPELDVVKIDPRDEAAIMARMRRPQGSGPRHADDGCEICKILDARARS